MKVNCIIDTCSCSYLKEAEFHQKTLLRHLYDHTKINICKEVHLEILDHKELDFPAFIQDKKLKLAPQKHNIDVYERKMFGKSLESRVRGGNKGEINSFILSVDQIHHLKNSPPVLITDDENAIRGVLSPWIQAFPIIKVWNSFEVILFLYSEAVIPSKDIAIEMLKSLIHYKGSLVRNKTNDFTKKLTGILITYNQSIEHISKLLN